MKKLLLSMSLGFMVSCATQITDNQTPLSHGPILGGVDSDSIKVWGRTATPSNFYVRYGTEKNGLNFRSASVSTQLQNDNTGSVTLKDLAPGTQYYYAIYAKGKQVSPMGSFKTLHDTQKLKSELNPDGLFNFSFEFACGNNQNPNNGLGPSMPAYSTLNENFREGLDFALLNGDWIYEEDRDFTVEQWQEQVGTEETPKILQDTPHLTGVWQNYKTYMDRAPNLMDWHRNLPSYFTFDDHELLNDIIGTSTVGFQDRRAVFRDTGTQGWYDYLGWANPTETNQGIHFGRTNAKKGSKFLVDKSADFTKIDLDLATNLHIHWNTEDAGLIDSENGDKKGGDPNAKVYEIVRVVDKHTLEINPPLAASHESHYSIGRHNFGTFKVANCRFILLDTKSQRDAHDIKNPYKKGISMIGKKQRDWMMKLMAKKDAEFYFVVSSVNFMVPHVGGGGAVSFAAPTKDDAWTVFFDEREKLIDFWDKLGKKVFILSGDLHNSYSVKITDSVWEFASGPHNSVNHRPSDEGNRPVNGPFKYGPRECEIRWSTTAMDDIPRDARKFPYFCIIKVNNVFNNPKTLGGERSVAFPVPQVMFQFYDALTGELKYVESILAK
ncbi:alkaline phosphatase D family protein [Lentisphaera marina]|uniref:alkaline phosphatase D family protein n=1 Tax=Lentisphaera marina TaxID=1111041 RepID=UPI00236672BC|nr:alkaline phosphatase D family protein [Lentisphaera marina]MDD7985001.1 alkaline phosphatase D family protein [Lentisphaera marina]